ncbi:phage tail assembly protein [Achromobacter mucicolens]|uniref:phage tail assembly protein n=1 Tax=Achromobacter mucicolens TaxID=1389922 RepID=UPI002446CD00|nr:phage tail assembly protein [Achromobacter mucicolens]MDH0092749.1 phage tail assembly protein [Achromobacter mucicolens]
MTEEYVLTSPIKAHGDEVKILTLRSLTPADARAVKALPYHVANDESVRIDTDQAAKYIVRMAGIPLSSVDQLNMVDFNALAWKVAGFFLGSASRPTTSSDASSTTSHTSGE